MSKYFGYSEWDDGERFMLSSRRMAYDPTDDSLGCGGGESLTLFATAEGRTYYKQAAEAREDAKRAQRRYDSLKAELARLVKRRSIRKRLMELIG